MIKKHILGLLVLCFLIGSCKSSKNDIHKHLSAIDSIKNALKINDSIRILKIDSQRNSIAFIDYNKKSEFHSKLLKYRGNDIDTDSYKKEYFRQLHEIESQKIIHVPNDFIKKWIPLYRFKGDYYLFLDCEYQLVYQTTDSTFISYYMDGGFPSIITDFLIQNKILKLMTTSDTIEIRPIQKYIYQLKMGNNCNYYTSSDMIDKFNIVVQQCEDENGPIIDFDKINCK